MMGPATHDALQFHALANFLATPAADPTASPAHRIAAQCAAGWGDIMTPDTPKPGRTTHQFEIHLYGATGYGPTLEQAATNWFNVARLRVAEINRAVA